jgi:hypothetical protein
MFENMKESVYEVVMKEAMVIVSSVSTAPGHFWGPEERLPNWGGEANRRLCRTLCTPSNFQHETMIRTG